MDKLIDQVTEALERRLFLELEASGRHVHLTKEAALALFGQSLTEKRPLSQPGQFLSHQRVTLVTEKGRLENVAVLGPERKDCQVELSMTDCVTLGISPPVRLSGHIEGTPGITLVSHTGTWVLNSGVIIAQRHIHMSTEDAALRKLSDGDLVRVQTLTSRPVIFEQVPVRVHREFRTCVHLDYDEANGCGFRKGDLGMIL